MDGLGSEMPGGRSGVVRIAGRRKRKGLANRRIDRLEIDPPLEGDLEVFLFEFELGQVVSLHQSDQLFNCF